MTTIHSVGAGFGTLRLAWFGTSIMQHLEAYNAQMLTQANLPEIDSAVCVEGWRNRG